LYHGSKGGKKIFPVEQTKRNGVAAVFVIEVGGSFSLKIPVWRKKEGRGSLSLRAIQDEANGCSGKSGRNDGVAGKSLST